jgi:2-oxoglutarate ferredoxin oxidoreductase subunit gamma
MKNSQGNVMKEKPAAWELLIAGVGGWGIITIGDLLAKAALKKYKHVVWFPSYATAMRGGESECCIIFSDEKIPSPIIYRSGTVMVLGAWRIKAFEDRVHPGGLMLIDTNGLQDEHKVVRSDIRVEYLPGMETAIHLGNVRNANLVMLGAYIQMTKALPPQLLIAEIEDRFGGKGREEVVSACKQACNAGMALIASRTTKGGN